MRIFLAIITISLCLSKISFAQGPFSDASKGITAQVLLQLLSMMGQYTWPESDEHQGAEAPNEDDPPPPSPSPSPFGRQGDANNGFWLIPPTKSPSPSPKPHTSLVPLTTTEGCNSRSDGVAIHGAPNALDNDEHVESVSSNVSDERVSLAQAKRLGTVNGLKLVGKGYSLPSDGYLSGWYRAHCPTATECTG
jgi:hypothetical protein